METRYAGEMSTEHDWMNLLRPELERAGYALDELERVTLIEADSTPSRVARSIVDERVNLAMRTRGGPQAS